MRLRTEQLHGTTRWHNLPGEARCRIGPTNGFALTILALVADTTGPATSTVTVITALLAHARVKALLISAAYPAFIAFPAIAAAAIIAAFNSVAEGLTSINAFCVSFGIDFGNGRMIGHVVHGVCLDGVYSEICTDVWGDICDANQGYALEARFAVSRLGATLPTTTQN